MEQALVFASIIIGVAISDQVMSLHRLLRTSAPVRWHWAQPWFAAIVLMTDMMVWWGLARDATGPISIGEFLPNVVLLILLALLTVSSLPDHVDEDGVDLAAFYQGNRRYQWILLSLAFFVSTLIGLGEALREGVSAGAFFGARMLDLVGIALTLFMAFMPRWRGVFIGLAITSIPPFLWLARTIG